MPLLTGPIAAAVSGPANDAWRWWTSELRAMLPEQLPLRRKSPTWSDIYLGRDSIVVDRMIGGTGERLAEERPIESLDADGWDELANLVEGTPARLILSPPDIFSAYVDLPPAAMRRLQPAVALQLAQLAPLEPGLLVWNSKLVSRDKKGLKVLVVMARSARVAEIQRLFWEHGIAAPPVFANVDDRAVELADGFETRRNMAGRLDRRAWLAAALLLASIPFTTWAGARMLIGLTESRIAAVQEDLAPRLAAEEEARNEETLRRALKPLFARPSAAEAIENLALGMPDSAYATQMTRDPGGAIRFTIEASDTEALAQTMSEAPLFAKASAEDLNPGDDGRMRVSYLSGGT